MNKNKSLFLLIVFVSALLFFSCQTTNVSPKTEFSQVEVLPLEILSSQTDENFQTIENGFEVISGKIDEIKVSWTCVKVDLSTQNLEIKAEPNSKSMLGKTFRLKKFAKKNKTIVAINTSPFDLGKTDWPIGITKINNEVITENSAKYCALGFYYDENNNLRAEIINTQNDENTKKFAYAFGGFFTTYEDGKIIPFQKNRRSRTACGINEDGSILYLFVITPNFKIDDRNGLNCEECSEILKSLGCTKIMQFDGGHSSGLCIYSKSVQTPFLQRKVPAAIGFAIK